MKIREWVESFALMLIRGGVCFFGAWLINDILLDRGYQIGIALNGYTFAVLSLLGFPGLTLLYGIGFWTYF